MLDALVADARLRWGLDPGAGLQIVSSSAVVAFPIEASRPLLIVPPTMLVPGGPPGATDIEPVPGRHGPEGRDPLTLLRRLYPGEHPVHTLADPDAAPLSIAALAPADLDRALYLPPVAPELASAGPWSMPYISERLRRPDGCPWDREQTHQSLRKHLLEETYEVYDALERDATPGLAEELGDLLLQVVLHAQLAAEEGVFDLADVQAALARKIVRRHPHVFGDAVAKTAADVTRQWERIKADERSEAAEASADGEASPPAPKGALDGISTSLPALAASQEMQERAAALGYDWPAVDGVLEKVAEELAELAAAASSAERREEFGDLLLVVVNVGRRLGIESESALRMANAKFRSRFRRVERMVAERGAQMRDLDFGTLDELWDVAKAQERAEAGESLASGRGERRG
ncbi:MAG TPA: nucleoside triphosphate pyrophosphohydrolase [Candidatus Limnocylindrales bacterium]|nr:nucleoside triphosphate pyrophosphohydrolase [Candidatus Limnocylindrales bacterium]